MSIRDAKSLHWAEHHLRCLHKIEHYVLQMWHKRFLVDDVEIDLIFTDNLNPNIPSDEINLAARIIQLEILVPVRIHTVLVEFFLEK